MKPFVFTMLFLAALASNAAVMPLAQMNVDQIRALDRARTVIIIPGGILEQHAGHLPSFADGYSNGDIAEALAAAVSAREGWDAVMFPMIPLGAGGANEIGAKYVYPGTYAVRSETLRAMFMDLATEFGEQGFRWIFVVHGHGSPWHNRALDQAGDYFRDSYGGQMVNLLGLEPDWSEVGKARSALVSKEALAEDADSVHAGLSETSRLLFLRPDLVRPVKDLRSITVLPPQMAEAARKEDWPGYFGAPRHASAEIGKAEHETARKLWIEIAMKILDGADPASFVRYADMMTKIPPIRNIGEGTARYDATMRERQLKWLEKKNGE